MKPRIDYRAVFVVLFAVVSGCRPAYLSFDADTPGETPKVFAQNVIAPTGEYVGYNSFSKNGKVLFYAITNADWSTSRIVRISSGNLSRKDTLFLVDKRYEGEPYISPDGKTMYFTVVVPPSAGHMWQADIYRTKLNDNDFGMPAKLNSVVNTGASEWHMSMTRDSVAYFSTEREAGTSALHGDIYQARLVGTAYTVLKKLPEPLNTKYNDSDPLVAPDGSWLIFHSDRPGGFGEHDLYITFNSSDNWSVPVNMGASINTAGWEMAPTLSPDGKYLFFTRRKAMITDEPARIWWVNANIIRQYKRSPAF